MTSEFGLLQRSRVTVDASVRAAHLGSIREELRRAHRPTRRFRLLAVAVAVVFAVPVIALAADRSQPGDFLFPVRQVVDRVTDLVAAETQRDHSLESDIAPTDAGTSEPSREESHDQTITDRDHETTDRQDHATETTTTLGERHRDVPPDDGHGDQSRDPSSDETRSDDRHSDREGGSQP